MDLFISPFSVIIFWRSYYIYIVLMEIDANKKQMKRAVDDIETQVSVFLHKTCCGYSLELLGDAILITDNQLYLTE